MDSLSKKTGDNLWVDLKKILEEEECMRSLCKMENIEMLYSLQKIKYRRSYIGSSK